MRCLGPTRGPSFSSWISLSARSCTPGSLQLRISFALHLRFLAPSTGRACYPGFQSDICASENFLSAFPFCNANGLVYYIARSHHEFIFVLIVYNP